MKASDPQFAVRDDAARPADAKESHLRSVLKAITYRILGTLVTFAIALTVTGDVSVSVTIGLTEPLVKAVVYYLHERAWQQVPHGTVRTMLGRR